MRGSPGARVPLEPPSDDERRLLDLLVAGVTDETAAARLGWNPRTLRRRLKALMEKLGASSRFQAGFLAARAGWMEDDPGAGSGQRLVHPHKGMEPPSAEPVPPDQRNRISTTQGGIT